MNNKKYDRISHHEIHSGKHVYHLSKGYIEDFQSKAVVSINYNFGGRMKGCIDITVDTGYIDERFANDPRFQFISEKKQTAFIAWIGYNRKCSLYTDLEGADGTRHMIRTALTIVSKECPYVKQFRFIDNSTKQCGDKLISLSKLSILLNAKTYYEKYMKAFLENEILNSHYRDDVANMTSVNAKVDFDVFTHVLHLKQETIIKIIEAYKSSKTYMEFFKALRSKYSELFCDLVYEWIDEFLNTFIFIKLRTINIWSENWIVSVNSIRQIDVIEFNSNIQASQATKILQEEFKQYYYNTSQTGGRYSLVPIDMDEV
jgi:hypothetical protein